MKLNLYVRLHPKLKMSFKFKLRVLGYLIMVNAVISMLIACRYFLYLSEFPTDLLGFSFLFTGTFSHMTVLASLIGLILIPSLFLPNTLRHITQASIASLALIALIIDTFVYAQYRFHINTVMLELVMSGQVVSFSLSTWLMVIAAITCIFAAQFYFIRFLEKKLPTFSWSIGKKFTGLVFVALLLSNGIHVWAAAHVYQPVTMTQRYLPMFYPMTSNKTMKKYGWIDEEALEKQKAMSLERKSDLNYPLTPIVGEAPKQPTNIMFIVIDSWRADTFNADNSPNLWSYAQNGKIFNQHYSTGNATRTGIFGMFYGIPGTYWHGMIVNRQSPVFIDRLQALNYQLGLFAAAKLTNPELHETAFSKVPNLRIGSSGKVAGGIDEELTQDWLKWYEKRDRNKPTFSFLFYDSPHGYSFPKDYPHQYKPMLDEVNYLKLSNDSDRSLMMNRYKTSVHYVDSIVKQVLDKLKETGDAENTLVIITGDHGQEVNDNLQNFWGHNGNFTDPQVKVPFAIIGPKIQADKLWNNQVLTSHQDIVPTLMKNYLGVTTKIHDYSVGEDLLGAQIQRDWILTSSYSKYGIVTPKNILEVGAIGQFEILDKKNQPMSDQEPNYAHVQAALEQISHFNK